MKRKGCPRPFGAFERLSMHPPISPTLTRSLFAITIQPMQPQPLPKLVVVELSLNLLIRSRERGIKGQVRSTGEWLLFVDADSWPSPELIRDVVPLLRSPDYIGCGSTIRVVDGPWWFKFTWESKNWSMRTFKWCPGGFILAGGMHLRRSVAFPRITTSSRNWSL